MYITFPFLVMSIIYLFMINPCSISLCEKNNLQISLNFSTNAIAKVNSRIHKNEKLRGSFLGVIFNWTCRKNQVVLFCALVLISVFLLTLSKQSCIKDRPHFTDPGEFADKTSCFNFESSFNVKVRDVKFFSSESVSWSKSKSNVNMNPIKLFHVYVHIGQCFEPCGCTLHWCWLTRCWSCLCPRVLGVVSPISSPWQRPGPAPAPPQRPDTKTKSEQSQLSRALQRSHTQASTGQQ